MARSRHLVEYGTDVADDGFVTGLVGRLDLLADDVVADSGPSLADDATLRVLYWHGHHGRPS